MRAGRAHIAWYGGKTYVKAAEIAKKAYIEGRAVIDVAAEETDIPLAKLKKLLDPTKLTKGGIQK